MKKQLLRDLKANPKKGAVLGLLFLVAIYFWAPLVGKLLAPGAESVAEEGAPPTTAAASPTPPGPAPKRHGWRQILAWMERDPLTKPAGRATFGESAFGTLDRTEAEAAHAGAAETEPVATEAPTITPESVGLKLSGTLVGAGRRTAIINGESYTEGHELQLADDVVFVLAEVSARRAVLERGDQRFVLELPARTGGK